MSGSSQAVIPLLLMLGATALFHAEYRWPFDRQDRSDVQELLRKNGAVR